MLNIVAVFNLGRSFGKFKSRKNPKRVWDSPEIYKGFLRCLIENRVHTGYLILTLKTVYIKNGVRTLWLALLVRSGPWQWWKKCYRSSKRHRWLLLFSWKRCTSSWTRSRSSNRLCGRRRPRKSARRRKRRNRNQSTSRWECACGVRQVIAVIVIGVCCRWCKKNIAVAR